SSELGLPTLCPMRAPARRAAFNARPSTALPTRGRRRRAARPNAPSALRANARSTGRRDRVHACAIPVEDTASRWHSRKCGNETRARRTHRAWLALDSYLFSPHTTLPGANRFSEFVLRITTLDREAATAREEIRVLRPWHPAQRSPSAADPDL